MTTKEQRIIDILALVGDLYRNDYAHLHKLRKEPEHEVHSTQIVALITALVELELI